VDIFWEGDGSRRSLENLIGVFFACSAEPVVRRRNDGSQLGTCFIGWIGAADTTINPFNNNRGLLLHYCLIGNLGKIHEM